MSQTHGLSSALARVLAGRGARLGDLPAYLDPTLRTLLPDPATLTDMDRAAARLAEAVQARRQVAIFGDYDVDGATSAALLGDYLRRLGVPFRIHIPDRITEGYGPNAEAIAALAAGGAGLLVCVDCGTTSHEALAAATRAGLDVVVLDHHQAPAALPAVAALVNPNRLDDLSGLGALAACGVVFLTIVALNRELRRRGAFRTEPEPDLMALLDLVALGTVADVVPLTGLNRAFVRQGLKVMRARARPGLAALADAARLSGPPECQHLGFLLGPRINAGGRIGNAALGSHLLLCDDPAEAARVAAELDALNRDRQVVEQAMVTEAEAEALAQVGLAEDQACVILVGSEAWHPGVVGLVAARLKERFGRPAIAIAWTQEDGRMGTGSARSVPGVDLGRAVRAAVEAGLLVKGGGHAMAAGVTLARTALQAFHAFLEERLAAGVAVARQERALMVDAVLSAGAATPALAADIERAGPFGQGQPEPVFAFGAHRLVDVVPVGEAHLRLRLKAGDGSTLGAIAFRAVGRPLGAFLLAQRGQVIHAAGTLSVDRWGGRERVDLRLLDAAVG